MQNMKTKITQARRSAARDMLDRHDRYDADTMRISRDGYVTACYSPDKVPGCNYRLRYYVGHLDAIA
jgi:hypothetical protein